MSVSIIIPTYNRKKFERLIEYNINCQTYENIVEVVVADDGDESQRLELNVKYPIKYIKCPRMTIGQKRNVLASSAKGEYIAHMDTDDIYFSTYISHSLEVLEKTKRDAVGTSDMIFMFADKTKGGMRNPYLSMANEATLVYKKSFWKELGFSEKQSSEGIQFLEGRHWQTAHSSINQVMICLCHSTNTVDKEPWRNNPVSGFPDFSEHQKILDSISL
jgi:glycosyltransferase involved in cell wall biosynthesis